MSHYLYSVEKHGTDYILKAEANVGQLSAHIQQTSSELQRQIIENEDKLVLECMTTDSLRKLKHMIDCELENRTAPTGQ